MNGAPKRGEVRYVDPPSTSLLLGLPPPLPVTQQATPGAGVVSSSGLLKPPVTLTPTGSSRVHAPRVAVPRLDVQPAAVSKS